MIAKREKEWIDIVGGLNELNVTKLIFLPSSLSSSSSFPTTQLWTWTTSSVELGYFYFLYFFSGWWQRKMSCGSCTMGGFEIKKKCVMSFNSRKRIFWCSVVRWRIAQKMRPELWGGWMSMVMWDLKLNISERKVNANFRAEWLKFPQFRWHFWMSFPSVFRAIFFALNQSAQLLCIQLSIWN